MIPKYIFQTHEPTYDNLPSFQKKITRTWINLNPEYTYVYMGAEQRREAVEKYYPQLIPVYDHVIPQLKADIWRYIMVYKFGGFYADMDSICIASLKMSIKDDFINKEMITTMPQREFLKNYRGDKSIDLSTIIVNNANFGAIKNSSILKNILDEIIKYPFVMEGWNYVFYKFVIDNKDKVAFEMDNCARHEDSLKTNCNLIEQEHFKVNYFGVKVLYNKFFDNV